MRRLLFFLLLGACLPLSATRQSAAQKDSLAASADSAVVAPDTLKADSLPSEESLLPDSTKGKGVSADSLWAMSDRSLFVLPDSLPREGFPRVSLLTCSPAAEVWQQYGHTALRYEDPLSNIDIVFNYGLFSFGAPHFIWRFCMGKTDYLLGAEEFPSFEQEYMERGSSIEMQVLNMSPSEVARFWALITENCRPANRVYRYNFLYKNCSTMARDIALQSIDGRIIPPADDSLTLREVMHEFNSSYPWASFGIDLLLGYEVDRRVGNEQLEFAPEYVMRHWARSARTFMPDSLSQDSLQRGETIQPWVKAYTEILPETPMRKSSRFPLTPMQMMILVLLLTAIIGTFELLTDRVQWWYDVFLYGIQGIAGIIISFLFFFSAHPAVGTNMLVFLFNPIVLILLPIIVIRSIKHKPIHKICWIELALIAAVVIAVIVTKQSVPAALWVFVGALLLRTLHHLVLRSLIYERMSRKKKK